MDDMTNKEEGEDQTRDCGVHVTLQKGKRSHKLSGGTARRLLERACILRLWHDEEEALENTDGGGSLRCKIPVLRSICISERPGGDTQEGAS